VQDGARKGDPYSDRTISRAFNGQRRKHLPRSRPSGRARGHDGRNARTSEPRQTGPRWSAPVQRLCKVVVDRVLGTVRATRGGGGGSATGSRP